MSTEVLVAIVALVSAILGATIGAATTYVVAVREERAAIERETRSHATEVKRAARLIDTELLRAHAAAAICVEKRHWWSGDVQPLSTEAWQKHSGTIAADLSDKAWGELIVAVEAVDHIRDARDRWVKAGLPLDPINDANVEQLRPMLRDITRGRAAIAPFASDSLPVAAQ